MPAQPAVPLRPEIDGAGRADGRRAHRPRHRLTLADPATGPAAGPAAAAVGRPRREQLVREALVGEEAGAAGAAGGAGRSPGRDVLSEQLPDRLAGHRFYPQGGPEQLGEWLGGNQAGAAGLAVWNLRTHPVVAGFEHANQPHLERQVSVFLLRRPVLAHRLPYLPLQRTDGGRGAVLKTRVASAEWLRRQVGTTRVERAHTGDAETGLPPPAGPFPPCLSLEMPSPGSADWSAMALICALGLASGASANETPSPAYEASDALPTRGEG